VSSSPPARPVSVAAAVRWLRDERGARAAPPFLVLFPGAVWVGASADGLFAGVLAAGLALLAAHRWWLALPGGLLLGASIYLSYGLVLAGGLAVGVLLPHEGRRWAAAIAAAVRVLVVVAAFTVAGLNGSAGSSWWCAGATRAGRRSGPTGARAAAVRLCAEPSTPAITGAGWWPVTVPSW
jgi:hypothetical protein